MNGNNGKSAAEIFDHAEGGNQPPVPKTDDFALLGRTAIYRDAAGNESAALIVDHDGEGKVTGMVFDRLFHKPVTIKAPLVMGKHVDAREQLPGEKVEDPTKLPRIAVFYEVRPPMRLGSEVLFRATVGAIANPKLPANIVGLLPGKVVWLDEANPGMVDVMLFPRQGPVMVAHDVVACPGDIGQAGTCWVQP